ncbi:hypothetical protein L207DRAFT_570477 [Hyaloscypha variabilis F]|uniref:Uncharacterized protein n=1 Tax=Hyaloscypha variabilis (strain UAMH 11265 / GT02V1 / F) TaxID=1149755 RepID=A0A2J6R8M3_HYAVF|nr:hypothetical protein L207DRAFT_570477 [Hyaloscypha variabilis F]
MSSSHPASQPSKPDAQNEKKKKLYTKYDAEAPPRCEMCDVELPDMVARRAHMAATKHCHCSECNAYVPPGMLYGHWSMAHDDLMWNDHAVAWTDNLDLKKAMPWVREAREAQLRQSH